MPLYGEKKLEYQRRWMAARREEWIQSRGGKCAKCGSTDKLEVDHIDPSDKRWNPSKIWSRNEQDRFDELAKCQVLCFDCHKDKTVSEMPEPSHGTNTMYNYGCRCVVCTDAAVEKSRRYRASKRRVQGT